MPAPVSASPAAPASAARNLRATSSCCGGRPRAGLQQQGRAGRIGGGLSVERGRAYPPLLVLARGPGHGDACSARSAAGTIRLVRVGQPCPRARAPRPAAGAARRGPGDASHRCRGHPHHLRPAPRAFVRGVTLFSYSIAAPFRVVTIPGSASRRLVRHPWSRLAGVIYCAQVIKDRPSLCRPCPERGRIRVSVSTLSATAGRIALGRACRGQAVDGRDQRAARRTGRPCAWPRRAPSWVSSGSRSPRP